MRGRASAGPGRAPVPGKEKPLTAGRMLRDGAAARDRHAQRHFNGYVAGGHFYKGVYKMGKLKYVLRLLKAVFCKIIYILSKEVINLTVAEILKMINAGYSKDEIDKMIEEGKAAQADVKPVVKQDGEVVQTADEPVVKQEAPDINEKLESLETKIKTLVETMQTSAARTTVETTTQTAGVEDILRTALEAKPPEIK